MYYVNDCIIVQFEINNINPIYFLKMALFYNIYLKT